MQSSLPIDWLDGFLTGRFVCFAHVGSVLDGPGSSHRTRGPQRHAAPGQSHRLQEHQCRGLLPQEGRQTRSVCPEQRPISVNVTRVFMPNCVRIPRICQTKPESKLVSILKERQTRSVKTGYKRQTRSVYPEHTESTGDPVCSQSTLQLKLKILLICCCCIFVADSLSLSRDRSGHVGHGGRKT